MFARTSKHVPSYQQYWQVGTSVAWADKEGGRNSSNSDYALFGAPGCFTWRGNLYGRQPGGLRRKSAMLPGSLIIVLQEVYGNLKQVWGRATF